MDCDKYDDCCEDVTPMHQLETNYECNIKMNDSFYAYSISKCDKKLASQAEIDLCEDLNAQGNVFNAVPVYSSQTKFVYKNIYCAKCNIKEINLENLTFFPMKALSSLDILENKVELTQMALEEYFKSQNLKENNELSGFRIEFENPAENAQIRQCIQRIDFCSSNASDSDKELCKNEPTAYRL